MDDTTFYVAVIVGLICIAAVAAWLGGTFEKRHKRKGPFGF